MKPIRFLNTLPQTIRFCIGCVFCCIAARGFCENATPPLLQVTRFRNQNLEDESYSRLRDAVQSGWTVPGLAASFVPQGIARIPETNFVLLSGYINRREKPTVLILVDHPSGKPLRTATLQDAEGHTLTAHAGGVVVMANHIWIPWKLPEAHDTRLYRFPLEGLLQASTPEVHLRATRMDVIRDTKGSVMSSMGNSLLIGDFWEPRARIPGHHRGGRTLVFEVNPETAELVDPNRPRWILHHDRRLQGIALREDGHLALSFSWGNRNSTLELHRISLSDPLERSLYLESDERDVPSWRLNDRSRITRLSAPPGSEGLVWWGDTILVPFEGGAYDYRDRWDVLEDRVLEILLPVVEDAPEAAPALPRGKGASRNN